MDAVIAEFKIMPVSTASSAQAIVFNKKPELGEMMKWHQEFQDQILQNALTYLYPVFGNLGFTRQLMMLAYGLGYLEFNSAHKSEIFLMVEEYIHEKSGILLSRQSCEQSRTIHCRSG